MFAGEPLEIIHRGGTAVQMNGENGARSRSDGAGRLFRIEIGGEGNDIGEDGPGTGVEDRFDGGDECVRGGDHLVAQTNSGGEQGEVESAGAGIDGDGEREPGIFGEFALERFDLGTEGERGLAGEPVESDENFLAQSGILGTKIEKGNAHSTCLKFSRLRSFAVNERPFAAPSLRCYGARGRKVNSEY